MVRARRVTWEALTRLPATATPRGITYTFGGIFIGAGLLVLLTLSLSSAPAALRVVASSLALLTVGLGAVVLKVGERMPRWAVHAQLVASVALLTTGVRTVPDDVSAVAYTSLLVLTVANALASCSWVGAGVHVLVVITGVAVGLGRLESSRASVTMIVVGVLLLATVQLARLLRAAAAVELDPLTGLPNRRGLERHLEEELARSARTGHPLALAVLDLDHFKAVNDEDGHAAGDRLLRSVAAAWAAVLPAGAVLARWGGDEFVLILTGGPRAGALDPAGAVGLVGAMRGAMPPGRSCTAGVATSAPGESASMLVSRADAALYAAKRTRRGTTCTAPAPSDVVLGARA